MKIAISGFKGAGKGTIAQILEQYGFIRMSCAAPLKDMVSILFSWPRHLLEGNTEESRVWRETPDPKVQWLALSGIFKDDSVITPRIVLQRIGTDLFRNRVHSNFWVNLLLLKEKEYEELYRDGVVLSNGARVPYRGIVLDDARFLNELSVCDYTIRVVRHIYTSEEIAKMHESETEHLNHNFDQVIYNTGTQEDLTLKVKHILPLLLK